MVNDNNIKCNENTLVEKYIVNIVDYENYENWLESKEAEGWNLKSIKYTPASIEAKNSVTCEHEFILGEKRKVRYCLDIKRGVTNDYKTIFQDFGWTLESKSEEYWLWAMEYTNERPNAFDRIEVMKERSTKYIKSIIKDITFWAVILIIMNLLYSGKISSLIMIFYTIAFIVSRVLYKWSDYKYLGVYLKNRKLINSYNEK
ncbi:MAG: DUF2812 domain-containing protein [Clostridium sp.]|uniref:DUF2812 domain-containing protein n=1 Tax=Clostridium sp. TaxID=1506 RepID=UPI0030558F4A